MTDFQKNTKKLQSRVFANCYDRFQKTRTNSQFLTLVVHSSLARSLLAPVLPVGRRSFAGAAPAATGALALGCSSAVLPGAPAGVWARCCEPLAAH